MFGAKEQKPGENPISIIFEEGTDIARVAEAIELLASIFGHDLHIVCANTLPPDASHHYRTAGHHYKKVA
jgi:hypothetical protein